MRGLGCPMVCDPQRASSGATGTCSRGVEREFVPLLARAGVAAGWDRIFLEVRPGADHFFLRRARDSLPISGSPAIVAHSRRLSMPTMQGELVARPMKPTPPTSGGAPRKSAC